jgi:CO/xanthine dehydrogenase FAD-binding subunit
VLSARCLTPVSLDELAVALRELTPGGRLLAGGTDLVRAMNQDRWEPEIVVDLSAVSGLAGVSRHGDRLHVGSMTTFSDLQRNELVRRHAPSLAAAAAGIGSVQTRNVATIGGNVANASPCADSVPALLALGATVAVMGPDGGPGERALEEIIVGEGRNGLAIGEVITGFWVPVLGGRRDAFVKVGPRTAVAVARLSMAAVVEYDGAVIAEARVALGAVGPMAFRDPQVEGALRGRPADGATAAAFADACAAAVCRSIPDRPSLPYKRRLAAGVAGDVWAALGFGS